MPERILYTNDSKIDFVWISTEKAIFNNINFPIDMLSRSSIKRSPCIAAISMYTSGVCFMIAAAGLFENHFISWGSIFTSVGLAFILLGLKFWHIRNYELEIIADDLVYPVLTTKDLTDLKAAKLAVDQAIKLKQSHIDH